MEKQRKAPGLGPTPAPSETMAAPQATIKGRDSLGREVEFPREQWRTEILPAQIQRHWSTPESLAQVIVNACEDGFPHDVLEASEHLLNNDPDVARSHVVRAINYGGLGRHGSAQEILEQAIYQVGANASLLYRLARVLVARQRTEAARETLERALDLDPNHEQSIRWWVEEQVAKDGVLPNVAYANLAERPASWRASLWLANHELEQKQKAAALLRYQSVLEMVGAEKLDDALRTISADLNRNGLHQDAIALVRPRYDEKNADAQIGVNLAESYLQLERKHEGLALLEELYALGIPVLALALRPYSDALEQLTDTQSFDEGKCTDGSQAPVSFGVFDRPQWFYGACDVSRWALPTPTTRPLRVAVLLFTANLPQDSSAQPQLMSESATRCCRALPLFVAESLYCQTALDVHVLVPVVNECESILYGAPETDEWLQGMSDNYSLILTGSISDEGGAVRARTRLRRLPDLTELDGFEETFPADEAGIAALRLRDRVVQSFKKHTSAGEGPRLPWYTDPPRDQANGYILALHNVMALSLLQEPRHLAQLKSARGILQLLQAVSMNLREHEPSHILFFSALAKLNRMGSKIVAEFERVALALLNELSREER